MQGADLKRESAGPNHQGACDTGVAGLLPTASCSGGVGGAGESAIPPKLVLLAQGAPFGSYARVEAQEEVQNFPRPQGSHLKSKVLGEPAKELLGADTPGRWCYTRDYRMYLRLALFSLLLNNS